MERPAPPALGVCYYPEHWPETRWAQDAALMREAGLTHVRIGEFAWAQLEPAPGRFDWAWLDRAIETLHAAGLRVVLGTPTATPPKWLVDAHAEILPADEHGRPRRFGSRRHYDFSSQVYRDHAARIAGELARRYGDHPAIAAWQTDNEYGCHDTTRSPSKAAVTAFRAWLASRYEDPAALNAAWGNAFWSQAYRSFDEVDLPYGTVTEPNPSHRLDAYRFFSDQVAAFDRAQTEAIRAASPDRPVLHNFMPVFADFDHFDVARGLDLVAWDSYPTGIAEHLPDGLERDLYARTGHPDFTTVTHDLMRGLKDGQGFWVMEQQCGQINWAPHNPLPAIGAVRLWTLAAIAHGADLVTYFRWRACRFAQEQMHSGLLRHDGQPDQGLLEVRALATEIAALREGLAGDAAVRPRVALLWDYPSLWAADLQRHAQTFDWRAHALHWYSALRSLGADVDIRGVHAALEPYRLIVVPAIAVADEALASRLERAAAAGTHVLVTLRSGSRTPTGLVPETGAPGALTALCGVRVGRFDSLRPGLAGAMAVGDGQVPYHTWAEVLDPVDAQTLGRHVRTRADLPYPDAPAMTRRRIRSGRVTYLGAWPTFEGMRALLRLWLPEAGLAVVELTEGVRLARRGKLVFATNWSQVGVRTPAPEGARYVVGGEDLPAAGAAVWRED